MLIEADAWDLPLRLALVLQTSIREANGCLALDISSLATLGSKGPEMAGGMYQRCRIFFGSGMYQTDIPVFGYQVMKMPHLILGCFLFSLRMIWLITYEWKCFMQFVGKTPSAVCFTFTRSQGATLTFCLRSDPNMWQLSHSSIFLLIISEYNGCMLTWPLSVCRISHHRFIASIIHYYCNV